MKMTFFKKLSILIISASALAFSTMPNAGCIPTQHDVEGPYYLPGAPFRTVIANPDEPGERLIIKGTISGPDCTTPLPRALVEVWQTDAGGAYYYEDKGYRLRGQLRSDKNGNYEFQTIKPGRYRIGDLGYRPAHIHIKVSHPGYTTLVTQIYFSGDLFLWPNDACGSGCRSNDPERIIGLSDGKGRGTEGTFDIILETKK